MTARKTKQKKRPDWEAIEREYRAGQLSIREIARQHGITHAAINKYAKKNGWIRNLTERVRERVEADLVTTEVSIEVTSSNAREREIVQAAAARGVEVVRQHRKTLSDLNSIIRTFTGKLMGVIAGEEAAFAVPIIRKGEQVGEKFQFPFLGERESLSDALVRVSQAAAKVIPLERQAFSLDKNAGDGGGREKEEPLSPALAEKINAFFGTNEG